MKQLTDTVLMIAPTQFGFNEQTAESNGFQNKSMAIGPDELQNLALREFQTFVAVLESNGIKVLEFEDLKPSLSPDSIFPNNWFSTHLEGKIISYPMLANNRRLERRKDILDKLIRDFSLVHLALESLENNDPPLILEGTGSMVLDRLNKVVYAVNSSRTNEQALDKFAQVLDYSICSFNAYGSDGKDIYHTNVLMCLGDEFIAIGLDNIDKKDRARVLESVQKFNKAIIPLKPHQVNLCFAGNMLQLRNNKNEKILVLSQSAYACLEPLQISELLKYNHRLLPISIPTIELFGGGSVRCMMAEIFSK